MCNFERISLPSSVSSPLKMNATVNNSIDPSTNNPTNYSTFYVPTVFTERLDPPLLPAPGQRASDSSRLERKIQNTIGA